MITNIRANVVRLITKAANATSWTPSDVLKEASESIKCDDKVMVLYGNSDLNSFTVDYIQCGMTASEMIALLEVAKLNIYRKMNDECH